MAFDIYKKSSRNYCNIFLCVSFCKKMQINIYVNLGHWAVFSETWTIRINFASVIYMPKIHEWVIKFPWALFLFTFNVIWTNIQNGVRFRCECWLVSWCQFIKIKQFTFWSPKQYTSLLSCEKRHVRQYHCVKSFLCNLHFQSKFKWIFWSDNHNDL